MITFGWRGRMRQGIVLVVGAFVLFGGTPARAGDPLFSAMRVSHVSGGVQAPEFRLETPEGKTVTLSGLRGKAVFLNFWATWCPPCRQEMPSMERLHQAFKDQGLVVLAVDIQESPKQVTRFMKSFRLSFSALLDSDGEVMARYNVRGIPTSYLIDRTGRIIGHAIGARNWASAEAKALIRSLLDRRPE